MDARLCNSISQRITLVSLGFFLPNYKTLFFVKNFPENRYLWSDIKGYK